MPIEGFPGAGRHLLCGRCRKWHEPEEGVVCQPEGMTGDRFFTALFAAARMISGLRKEPQFVCHRCLRVRRRVKIAIFGVLGLLIVLVLVLERFGVV